jgi:hypothetical protein
MSITKVITPPDIKKVDGPIIFLAGPIQGAYDWQKEAIEIISALNKELTIALPRKEYLDKEFIYEKQVDWETHHLNLAAKNGVILFWLAKEDKVVPGRAYAQTSRFELGEWKARSQLGLAKLVVGIEDGFSNSRYIRRRLMQDCPSVPVSESLEETCTNAVKLISWTKI